MHRFLYWLLRDIIDLYSWEDDEQDNRGKHDDHEYRNGQFSSMSSTAQLSFGFIWNFLSSLSFDWCLLYLIILKIYLIIFLHLQAFIVFRILRYLILSVAVYVVITKLIRPRAAKFTYNIVLSRNWRLACF